MATRATVTFDYTARPAVCGDSRPLMSVVEIYQHEVLNHHDGRRDHDPDRIGHVLKDNIPNATEIDGRTVWFPEVPHSYWEKKRHNRKYR